MALYLLIHRHEPSQCGPAAAAWKGFDSPLRHQIAMSSCVDGGHRAWWRVEAADAESALAQLPPFMAERTEVEAVREVEVP